MLLVIRVLKTVTWDIVFFFFSFFSFFFFLERGEVKEKERETSICSLTTTGGQQPRHVPLDQNQTSDLALCGTTPTQLSHTSQDPMRVLMKNRHSPKIWQFQLNIINRFLLKFSQVSHHVGSKIKWLCPSWCGSVDWVPACELKGRQFNSQSGHLPGLQARSPVVGHVRSNHTLMFPSFSFSFPSPLL